ncbi:MAG: TolC family protein [Fibrobacteres bacterium]|nr:TolC family protein [Fibrobacterota bacterium]
MPNNPVRLGLLAATLPVLLLGARAHAESLTLEQAIREAMAHSEEALILKEKTVRFKALEQQAWSSGFPRISAYADVGRGASPFDPSSLGFKPAPVYQKNPDGSLKVVNGEVPVDNTPQGGGSSVINIAQTRMSYGVQADQSLFSFGRLSQAIHTAGIQERANESDQRRSLQQLQLQVLDAYYGAVTAKARLGTFEASTKRATETVNFLQTNFKMGAAFRRSDVLRAVTYQKSLEPQRLQAERDAAASLMALNRVLGRALNAQTDLDTSAHIAVEPVSALPDSQSLDQIISERPDVRAMELSQQSLEGQAKYLKMQYLPSLGATGKVGVLAYKLNQLGELEQNREWQVGIGLNWPIFDGMGLMSQAHQLQSDARSLGLSARQARKMMRIEIENAWRDYQTSDTSLAAAQQAVQAAQAAQEMLSEDFRAGKGQLTDLLEAEQAFRDASFGYLGANHARIRSQAALRLALGKALITEEVP